MQTITSTVESGAKAAAMTAVGEAEARLRQFFASDAIDVEGLGRWLDGLDEAARVAATVSMTPGQQARLFEAAQGVRALTLDHFVPAAVAPLETVRHAGKNSIRLISRFEKRFCRPEMGSDVLWGYNESPWAVQRVAGPGYFVCYAIAAGEALIDYCQVPPGKPDAWPQVVSNSVGIVRYIFGGTQDTMRGISEHVSIGRAARAGQWMDNWFVLCRRTPQAARQSPQV
jgi:hypothetical protein